MAICYALPRAGTISNSVPFIKRNSRHDGKGSVRRCHGYNRTRKQTRESLASFGGPTRKPSGKTHGGTKPSQNPPRCRLASRAAAPRNIFPSSWKHRQHRKQPNAKAARTQNAHTNHAGMQIVLNQLVVWLRVDSSHDLGHLLGISHLLAKPRSTAQHGQDETGLVLQASLVLKGLLPLRCLRNSSPCGMTLPERAANLDRLVCDVFKILFQRLLQFHKVLMCKFAFKDAICYSGVILHRESAIQNGRTTNA